MYRNRYFERKCSIVKVLKDQITLYRKSKVEEMAQHEKCEQIKQLCTRRVIVETAHHRTVEIAHC